MEEQFANKDALSDHLLRSSEKYRKRFYISVIALIFVLLAFITVIIIVVVKKEKTDWEELPQGQVHKNVDCISNEKDMHSQFSQNLWNTPKRYDKRWKENFQDMNVLVGYPQLRYNEQLTECEVTVFTKTAVNLDLTYYFDGQKETSNKKKFNTDFKKILKIKIEAKTGEKLELEDVDFIWNVEKLAESGFDFENGQRGAIVEMYGWFDTDIEKECEFLGKNGYMGVKVFPHHEQVMSDDPFKENLNPWYFMYQPVSYSLNGRLGSRNDLRKMINTCRSKGVRVYADAVVNHMTYNGMDLQKHRLDKSDEYLEGDNKYSTSGSPFWTPYKTYEINPYTKRGNNALEYPRVPYGPMDFHCQKLITDYKDFDNVMYGWLDNLADLNTESIYVRQRIADYLTDLFSIGITGYRLDAAKHIKPTDIAEILYLFKKNIGGKLPKDFFTWLEILSGDEADILFAEEGENSYAGGLNKTLTKLNFTEDDILKVKIWWSSYPKNYTIDAGKVDPRRKVIQNDDHDTQYADFRGLNENNNSRGCVLSTGCKTEMHRNFEEKLFLSPFNVTDNSIEAPIRMILSSFYMDKDVVGLPDGKSDCKNCKGNCGKCKYSQPSFPGYIDENPPIYSGKGFSRCHRDPGIISAMQKWINKTFDDFSY